MIANRTGKTWVVQDGDDEIYCWLDEDGFYSQRYSRKTDGGLRKHAIVKTLWHEIIAKSEGQKLLL